MSDHPQAASAVAPAVLEALAEKARRLRIHSLRMTTAAGSGHPTSCLSAAELVAATFFYAMRFDPAQPDAPTNDRFVLSKGHAAPILYAALAEAGVFPVGRLATLRQFASELEGHPTPRVPGVDAATGSLGQGLSIGAGLALAARLESHPIRVYVLLGDGELAEGNVWEAAAFAAHYQLDNLIALADINALGQSQPTMYGHELEIYRQKFHAQGWQTEVVDGHDLAQVVAALDRAKAAGRPVAILARTVKGRGVSFVEGKNGWHGRAFSRAELERALAELGPVPPEPPTDPRSYERPLPAPPTDFPALDPPTYPLGQQVATREAFGTALARLGAVVPRLVVLDGDVQNSTHTQAFAQAYPERFFQGYIAEQNLVATAVGLAARGWQPVVATFACFLTRAYDQIRMAAISRSHLKLCGSHAGVSIGEDGPSQMGLEDLAALRAIPGSTVLYPADAVAAERLTEALLRRPGIAYLRTTRPKTPVIYAPTEAFPVPGFKLHGDPDAPAAIIAAGITLFAALEAARELAAQGIGVRVVDLYCVKPIDGVALAVALGRASQRLVVVEDHYAWGGIGEAVLAALAAANALPRAWRHLAVERVPHSGKPDQLLDAFGLSPRRIADAVRRVLAA